MKCCIAFLLLAACSGPAIAQAYEVQAYEGPGMQPIPGEIIIPDARRIVPQAIRSCGIQNVETIEATDGVVLFRFRSTQQNAMCLKQALPKGTQLRSLGDAVPPPDQQPDRSR